MLSFKHKQIKTKSTFNCFTFTRATKPLPTRCNKKINYLFHKEKEKKKKRKSEGGRKGILKKNLIKYLNTFLKNA